MKQLIAFLIILTTAPSMSMALSNSSGLGFAVGAVSGTGFSFRSEMSNQGAVQLTAGVLVAGEHGGYSIGLEYLMNLRKSPASRFYALLGGAVHGTTTSDDAKIWGKSTNSEAGLGFGFGIGWERFYPQYGMGFSLELPLTYIPSVPLIMPLPQLAVHYYFK